MVDQLVGLTAAWLDGRSVGRFDGCSVGWLDGRSVGRSVIISLKGREVTLANFYRSTRFQKDQYDCFTFFLSKSSASRSDGL